MTIYYVNFKNLNSKYKKNTYFLTIKENTYILKTEWNDYCNCAFLSVYNDENEPIVIGKALTNKSAIRNYKLPYILLFFQKDGENYEPTIDNIEKEFILAYEDGKD